MDLLERYLQAVHKYLPWTLSAARQKDILAELRSDFESQLEEREAGLGRPLTEGEMIDWIKQLGAPMQIAARYQPVQYLIGPALFPIYLYVVRIAVIWTLIIYAVIAIIALWAPSIHTGNIVEWIWHVPGVMLNTAFWVTLVFVALEIAMEHHPGIPIVARIKQEWSPTSLPPLEWTPAHSRRHFAQAVAEVIFGYLFLVWLMLLPRYPFLWLGPGAMYLHAGPFAPVPVWWTFYWVVLAVNCSQAVWNTIELARGAWRSRSLVKQVAFKAFGMISMGVLAAAPGHVYAVLRNPAQDAARYGAFLNGVNENIWRGLLLCMLIAGTMLLWDIVMAERQRRSA
jgi:hypothetical protein